LLYYDDDCLIGLLAFSRGDVIDDRVFLARRPTGDPYEGLGGGESWCFDGDPAIRGEVDAVMVSPSSHSVQSTV
jgi:hypothetical protein